MKQLSLPLITVLISLFGTGQNAYLTSALINSCNGTCSEGDNEILFGNTGNGTLNVTPANLQIFYGTTSPASTSYTDALTTNPTTTSNLIHNSCKCFLCSCKKFNLYECIELDRIMWSSAYIYHLQYGCKLAHRWKLREWNRNKSFF